MEYFALSFENPFHFPVLARTNEDFVSETIKYAYRVGEMTPLVEGLITLHQSGGLNIRELSQPQKTEDSLAESQRWISQASQLIQEIPLGKKLDNSTLQKAIPLLEPYLGLSEAERTGLLKSAFPETAYLHFPLNDITPNEYAFRVLKHIRDNGLSLSDLFAQVMKIHQENIAANGTTGYKINLH